MIPTINKECSNFLNLSKGNYLIKYLKSEGEGLRKVKVRRKKWNSEFVEVFNSAFPEYNEILQRSIITSHEPNISDGEAFYIFPIDGFKFLYNPNVKDIVKTYKEIFLKLKLIFSDESSTFMNDILKNGYMSDKLDYAINENSQIIIYNIPYYYALRKSLVDDYTKIIYDN